MESPSAMISEMILITRTKKGINNDPFFYDFSSLYSTISNLLVIAQHNLFIEINCCVM